MDQEIKTINIPVEVLGLSDIKIKSVGINRDREVRIEVASTKEHVLCRKCNNPTRGVRVSRTARSLQPNPLQVGLRTGAPLFLKISLTAKATLAGIELHRMLRKGQHKESANRSIFEQFYSLAG